MTIRIRRNDAVNHSISRVEMETSKVPVAPFFVLGLFMPIDFVQGVPPAVFDVVRYGAALLIVFMAYSQRSNPRRAPLLGIVALLLIASGALSVVKSAVYGGSLFGAAVALISALAAYWVIKTQIHHR